MADVRRRRGTRTRAVALDSAAVLVTVALLSVPRLLVDGGLPDGGLADAGSTDPPDAFAPAAAPPDAVPPGPVRPVDDEPLVASRDPFEQLVVPEPPEAEGTPAEGDPARGEGAADGPDSVDRPRDDMAPVELPEPEEQAPPPEESTASEGGVSPSDEPASSEDGDVTSRVPSPAAAGPEALRLERVAVDEAGVERAHITVGSERYTPAEGEDFGDGYRLAEIDAPCVRIARGDELARVCEAGRVFAK